MAARRRKVNVDLDVDDRTTAMSNEALFCRKLGHNWQQRGMTRRRYHELIQQGIMEDALYCANGCGWTWDIVYTLRNGDVITSKRRPPRDSGSYLMPAGSGRMNRAQARVAYAARQVQYA